MTALSKVFNLTEEMPGCQFDIQFDALDKACIGCNKNRWHKTKMRGIMQETLQKKVLSMKYQYFIAGVLLLLAAATVHAGESQGPILTFANPEYDCGTIYFDEVDIKTLEIEFSNTGDSPLVVNNIRACCGTVVTDWTREPVLPGEKGKIEVRFRVAKRPHMIRRVISVESNSADNPRQRHRITGRAQQGPD